MNKELTVLIIDDCEDDAILLAREISRAGYKVDFEYVSSLTSLEKALESNRWDIIISDYSLPGFNGLSVLNMIKEKGYDIPFIMVSGTIGENLAVEIMKSGAHDYVMKDNLTRLVPAIKRELREAEIRREKKLAEEALRKSEERYRILFEHANEGILVLKREKIIFANPKFLKATGYVEDISHKSFFEFIHKDDREMVRNYHYKRLKGEKVPDNYTFRFYDRDGNIRHVQLSGAIINWDGEAAVLVFLNDITEKKKWEEELLKIEKLESLGLLAGGIAHDFNNILTSVLASISIGRVMLENDEKDKLFEILANVEKASLRAKDLTYQLLTFAKGGLPVKKTGIISDVIKEAANFALIGTKSTCEFHFPGDLWPVSIDEGQISQVIQNLVLNAEQSMNRGTISISGENIVIDKKNIGNLKNGTYVKITIKDQGCGIEEKYLQKIFDPYFTTKPKSSGLGLTIAYSIIRNHSGHVVAESVKGKGTTVTFFLPVSEDVHIPEKSSQKEILEGKGRILVMDDDEMLREVLEIILERLKYDFTMTEDGEEAIKLYKQAKEEGNPFDAVIVDLTIPGGMGGKEAIGKLREIDPDIKAIVSSGYSSDPVMADYKRYGFSAVILKPYGMEELSKTLYDIIVMRDA